MPTNYQIPADAVSKHDIHHQGITIKASSTSEGIVWHLPGGGITPNGKDAQKCAISLARALPKQHKVAA